jgi:hypothetical protein
MPITCSDHHQRTRDAPHAQHGIGVHDVVVVELDLGGPRRLRPGGDDDVLGGDGVVVAAVLALDRDGVLVHETGGAAEDLDVVAQQLAADHLHLPPDDARRAREQVGDGDLGLHAVARAVHVALGETGKVEHRLAQRLRRDRAGV